MENSNVVTNPSDPMEDESSTASPTKEVLQQKTHEELEAWNRNLSEKEHFLKQETERLVKKEEELKEREQRITLQENAAQDVKKQYEQKLEEVIQKEKLLETKKELDKKNLDSKTEENKLSNTDSQRVDNASTKDEKSNDQVIQGSVKEKSSAQAHQSLYGKQTISKKYFEPVSLLSLEKEYKNELILAGINELNQKYSVLIKTRGDGNCLYRSFGYLFCKYIIDTKPSQEFFDALLNLLSQSPEFEFQSERIKNQFIKAIQNPNPNRTFCDLLLQNEQEADGIVIKIFRMLTVVGLHANKSDFSAFYSESEFNTIISDAETNEVEAEQNHIVALCKVLQSIMDWKYNISLEIIQVSRESGLVHYDPIPLTKYFQGKQQQVWAVLFRPGHYDALLGDVNLCPRCSHCIQKTDSEVIVCVKCNRKFCTFCLVEYNNDYCYHKKVCILHPR